MIDGSGVISMDADTVLMHERVLVERARSGNRLAFEEIYRQTAPAAWRLAMTVTRDDEAAAAAVAAGYAKVLNAPASTAAPQTHPVATQLLRATREAALDAPPAAPPTGGPLALRAFHELPERQRAALWLVDVEDRDERAAATALGLTTDAATELAARARAGLRQRAAALQLESIEDQTCIRTTELLDGYATEELSIRDAGRVRRHLDGCDECRARLTELDDLLPRLRRATPLLPIGLLDDTERAWRAAAAAASGPLHLRLPGGTHVPPWAERALAGAAAAVVTLGITGALIAGRGGKSADQLAREAATSETPLGSGDGESALGDIGDLPLSLPDGAPVPGIGGSGGSGGSGGGQSTTSGSGELALPRQVVGGTDDSPAPRGGTTDPAPPTTEPPAPPPTTPPAPSTPEVPEVPPAPSTPVAPESDPLTGTVDTVVDTVEGTVDDACSTLGVDCGDVLEPLSDPLSGLGL